MPETVPVTPLPGRPISRGARVASAAVGRRWRLPAATGRVRVLRDVDVPMRDGTTLRADVHLPATAGPHPTILLRSPYGRGGQFTVWLAQPYAARGYAVVMQSVRGTFGSGGEFSPVVNEEHDAQDTVVWLREQTWFDGRLATLGPSYLGYAQWALALDPPPELKTMILHIAPHDLALAGIQDGAFELGNLATWTDMVAHQERLGPVRGMMRLATAERRLAPALARLPIRGLASSFGGTPSPWFDEWVDHPDLSDPYWDRYRATAAVHSSTVPTLLIGGWQDWFLEQTLYQYAVLRDRGVDVGLTVGPWSHLTVDAATATREGLAWLAQHMPVGDAEPGPARPDRVCVYVTGAERWRGLVDWPPATTDRTWWLAGAGYLAGAGLLRDEPPTDPAGTTSFRYDPLDPTPSVGGRVLARSAGRRENTTLELREDVITFTSRALDQPAELLGRARVRLCLSTDNPYADVFVRLCDVDPKGRSVNVTDRLVRLDPAPGEQPVEGERAVEVTLPDIAHRFLTGHSLRLQISGGAHPRYARNPGTGEPAGTATTTRPATIRIHHSADSPSSLTLPLG